VNNSFAHMTLHAVPYNQETHGRKARGNQQHGEQKAGAQPRSRHQCDSGLLKNLGSGFG
jgi:hypothetical protein